MNLTRDDWVKVVCAFGAVTLTVALNILVRETYQPDVRYEVGSWYRSTDVAVASLRLQNLGRSDAENVTVTASFADPLTDIATGDPAIHFDISAGGIGQKAVTGIIKRLVPNETAYIYFAIKPSLPWSEHGQFIRGIKFNGGQGKTGKPFLAVFTLIAISFVTTIIGAVISFYLSKRFILESYSDRLPGQVRAFYANLDGAIQLGLSAAEQGLSEEQFHTMMEERYGKVTFRKQSLIVAAQAAFAKAKHSPTPTGG